MPRRNPDLAPSRKPPETPRPEFRPSQAATTPIDTSVEHAATTRVELWAERLRKLALGLVAALVVARSTWPGEIDDERTSGLGPGFVVLMVGAALIAAFSSLLARRLVFRLGRVDLALAGLFVLMAASASHAPDKRLALNLAWQMTAVGLAFLLLRFLPRGPREHAALAALLVSAATALAAYGLYQVAVLHPEVEREYRRNPTLARQAAGVGDDASARQQFEDRLLGSKEPTATFALANSLGGFLLTPSLLAIAAAVGLARSSGLRGTTVRRVLLAALLALILSCLLLTKSRTSYVGLLGGLAGLVYLLGPGIHRKAWMSLGAGLLALLGGLVVAGLALGQLDRWVVTGATRSLQFRREYWLGTMRMLRSHSAFWWVDVAGWWGTGLGNFAGPYLKHKLPEASEGIRDPHNLILEIWATAGFLAMLMLCATLFLGLRDLFSRRPEGAAAHEHPPTEPQSPAGWLLAWGGLGGWVLAMLLRPDLSPFATSVNPFTGDWMRWAVLLVGGAFGMFAYRMAAPDLTLVRSGLAAGFLATAINLLGAGGITFAPVALMLWASLALALNLRTDRACGKQRVWEGFLPAFLAGALTASLAGTFVGTEQPYYRALERMSEAERAAAQARRLYQQAYRDTPANQAPADRARHAFEKAEPWYNAAAARYKLAAQLDPYLARPYVQWAEVDLEGWQARGAVTDVSDLIWHRVDSQLRQAVTPPRDPSNLAVQVTRARIADRLLEYRTWPPIEQNRLLRDRAQAYERACDAYPSSATLNAEHARALAALRQWLPAIAAGQRAQALDKQTPHLDKKLDEASRARLERELDAWRKSASEERADKPAA